MNKKRIERDALFNAPNLTIYTHYNMLMACVVALLSYLAVRFIQPLHMEALQAIILMLYVIFTGIYARLYFPFTHKDYRTFGFIILCCIPNIIFDNYILKFFNTGFILCSLAYALLSISNKQIHKNGKYFFIDMIHALCSAPLQGIQKWITTFQNMSKDKLHFQHFSGILIGILISIPVLFVILPLLVSADASFQRFFLYFFDNLDKWGIEFFYLIFTIPVFFYLYSLVYAPMNCERTDIVKTDACTMDQYLASKHIVPLSIPITLEIILIFVYTLFLTISTTDILRNLHMSLTTFSFSQFAREGFFQLCIISTINLLLLTFIQFVSKDTNTSLQHIVKRILCLETIALLLTAMLKMILYIIAYGLTPLRIYSSWFLFVLFGVFLLILYHTNRKEEDIIRHIVKYFCISFLFLNFLNVDVLVTTFNQNVPALVDTIADNQKDS